MLKFTFLILANSVLENSIIKLRRNRMTVVRSTDVKFQQRSPGVRTRQLINQDRGSGAVTMGEAIMDPGASLDLHTHKIEEAIIIAEGTATLKCGNDTQTLVAGDAILAPAAEAHLLANNSNKPMKFIFFFPAVNTQRESVNE
jgi:quercetin dioxygenase-like cupin family protein